MSKFNFPPCPLRALSKVWVYLRDSGGETQDLASQRAYMQAYCQHYRLVVEREFEDAAQSGGSTVGRDAFQQMIDTARNKESPHVEAILYWDMKRFARNQIDSQFYMADLRRRGYRLVSLSDDIPDNEFSGVVEAFLQWKAQKDRDDISKDSKRGLAFIIGLKDEAGNYIGIFPGRAPTFFATERYDTGLLRNDGRPRIVQRIVPDPDTWEKGKLAWEMRANRRSYKEIEQATRMFPDAKSPGGIWSTIFKNEIYIGRLHYGGRVYDGFVPALATPEQWQAVQAQRKSPKRKRKSYKRGKTQYLLSGLLTCQYCGSAMHGGTNRRKDRKTFWRFYVCGQKKSDRSSCPSKQMTAERLEKIVIEAISTQVLTVDFVDKLTDEINRILGDQSQYKIEITRLEGEIDDLERRIDNLLRMTELTASLSVAKQLEAREHERAQKKQELDRLAAQIQQVVAVDSAEIMEMLSEWKNTLNSGQVRGQQIVLQQFVKTVFVGKESVRIDYTLPMTRLYLMPPTGFVVKACQLPAIVVGLQVGGSPGLQDF